MTAIGLTSLIYLACLALSGVAFGLGRVGALAGFANAKRTMLAVHRATLAGLSQTFRASLAFTLLGLISWAAAHAFWASGRSWSRILISAWITLATTGAGALAAVLLAFAAVYWARASAVRSVVAALISTDGLLVNLLRSSVVLTTTAEAFGFVSSIAVFGAQWVSETTSAQGPALHLHRALHALTDFTVGALLITVVVQTSGTTLRASTKEAASSASVDTNLSEYDPRNPSAIAEAAGVQLGQLLPNALDAFCSVLVSNVLILALASYLRVGEAEPLASASYLLLPFLVRAFGTLATLFAAGSARTKEAMNPGQAFWRSQAVFVIVILGAISGCCVWLTGEYSVRLIVCGTIGVAIPVLIGHLQTIIGSRGSVRSRPQRPAGGPTTSDGLFSAMAGLFVPLLVALSGAIAIERIGSASGNEHTRWLGLFVGCLGANSILPYFLTVESTHSLVCLARRIAHLVDSLRVDDGQRRLARVEDALSTVASHALSSQTQSSVGLPLLATFLCAAFWSVKGSAFMPLQPMFAVGAGCLSLWVPLALASQASLRAGYAVRNEVRRQLTVFSLEAGQLRIPQEFTPSYRSCVDIAVRECVRGVGPSSYGLVLLPLLYAALLAWTTPETPQLAVGLASFLAVVTIAVCGGGFAFELASQFIARTWPRAVRIAAREPAFAPSSALHHLSMHATPAVRLLAKIAVVVAVAFSPYVI